MSSKAMSLKAKIKNLSKEKGISAQVFLQNYMFERFLERLSKSIYKDKFILKGGILIAAIVGIDNRATMDIDATIKNYPINIESITKAISEICNTYIDDDVTFTFSRIEAIRDDDDYGGYRVGIISKYDSIITPIHIDITSGDVITPKEIHYLFKMMFDNKSIEVWAYNIETILAEKVETILRRGQLNTRPRDFYDVYILAKTQPYDRVLFYEALKRTSEHRASIHILSNISRRIYELSESETLKERWIKYTKNYKYAVNISYENIIDVLNNLFQTRENI